MIKFLIRTFYYETKIYYTDSSHEEIVNCLESLLSERKGLFQSPNLTGTFLNYPNAFTLRPKWSIAVIRNFERGSAYLKGIIQDTEDNKTKIEISVRPNSVMGILFLFFLPFGLYNLYAFLKLNGDRNNLLLGLSLLIFALLQIGIARVMADTLRQSFKSYLTQCGIHLKSNRH